MKKITSIVNDPGFDKKEQILDVAEKLFSKNGFDAVSVRDLAKEAGINIAMVSYYFGSKENLYLAVIERKVITIRQDIGNAFPNGGNPWDKLYFIIDRYVERMVENREFMHIVFSEMGMSQREHITAFLAKRFADNQDAFRAIIEEGIKEGVFRQVDAQLTIVSIIGPMKLYISSPLMVKRILGEGSLEDAYSTKHRNRIKEHLRDMLTRFLTP